MTEILVPNRVDAILIDTPRQVTGPMSDFEILPWFDKSRDHYSTVPYLASAINAQPFAEHSYWLEPGVHLHWTLPDGLTRGTTHRAPEFPIEVDNLWFAAAPNRWLIRRRASEANWDADRVWLVESDYIYTSPNPHTGRIGPSIDRPNPRAIAYPRHTAEAGEPPYMFMGRQVELDPKTLKPKDRSQGHMLDVNTLGHYAAPLTALGYGDPAFAAHYPTCRSVFGLFDDKPAKDETGQPLDRFYDVYGWYSDQANDPLAALVTEVLKDEDRARSLVVTAPQAHVVKALDTSDGAELTDQNWQDALVLAVKRRFGWEAFPEQPAGFPDSLMCHARTHLKAQTAADDRITDTPTGEIGIGSSPAEAYSAYLMRSPGRARVGVDDQDQLVQSLAATDLAHHPLDLGRKLAEARHNEQFRSMPGNSIWVIRPREGASETTDGISLPDDIADALNALNDAQRAYDTAIDQIDALRQETYSDWAHYMRAVYPEGDTDPFTVDLDTLRALIERTRLEPLEDALDHAGHLYFGEDTHGNQIVTDRFALPSQTVGERVGDDILERLDQGEMLLGLDVFAGAEVNAVHIVGTAGIRDATQGSGTKTQIRLLPNEKISVVSGGWGKSGSSTAIAQLVFETSFGRHFGPFGKRSGNLKTFRFEPPRGMTISGLQVTQETHLTSLGLLYADPHSREAEPSWTTTLARTVVRRHAAVMAVIHAHKAHDLIIGATPGARYWVPNDPVIALGETFSQASTRHGHDGLWSEDGLTGEDRKSSRGHLEVIIFDLVKGWKNKTAKMAGATRMPNELENVDALKFGHLMWMTLSEGENWHPLQVEWQAEIQPLTERGNLKTGQYDPQFALRSQKLPDAVPELMPIKIQKTKTYEYLSGRSFLNPAAGRLMKKRLDALPDTSKSLLTVDEEPPIILPLGGFHDQLMMRASELQLPVADPVGLPAQKALAARVRRAVGAVHPLTPMGDSPFHPIRSGDIILQRLRVIDSFGRTREWRPDKLHTTKRMQSRGDKMDRANLPMRLAQAARLDFRWLSATNDAVEANVHPATTPVCGWVIANELDREVALYANDGRMVGTVDTDGQWQSAPGDPAAPRTHRDIADPHLARFAEWLCETERAEDLVDAFLDTVEDMLEKIDPAHAASHQSRAMLISRPLALVRAQIDLNPRHHIAQDQSWRALRARMMGADPDTHGVGEVKFGVRLGEVDQVNDGLCGYWVDDAQGRAKERFFTPSTHKGVAHDDIKALTGAKLTEFPVQVSYSGAPALVTMLMDPLGVVHATTGLLPTKSIGLPMDQVKSQTEALRVIFATGPILTPKDGIEIPLPSEPGFAWSWLEHDGEDWNETPHHPTIAYDDFVAGFSKTGPALWIRLVQLGRLVHVDHAHSAQLMPASPNADPARFDDLGLSPAAVERGLHDLAQSIEDTSHEARLEGRVMARDGWLQMRPLPAPSAPADDTPNGDQE